MRLPRRFRKTPPSPPRQVLLPGEDNPVLANGHSGPPSPPSEALEGPQETHQGILESILCFPTAILEDPFRFSPGPFCGVRGDVMEMAGRIFPQGRIWSDDFRPRTKALEHDVTWTQVIAVAVPWHASTRQVWTYRRGGTEGRLHGKLSCLVGGHVNLDDAYPLHPETKLRDVSAKVDLLDITFRAVVREMGEEVADWAGNWKSHHSDVRLTLMAVVHDTSEAVDRVHLGILYRLDLAKLEIPLGFASDSGIPGDWIPVDRLAALDPVESWTRHVARHLAETSPVRTTT